MISVGETAFQEKAAARIREMDYPESGYLSYENGNISRDEGVFPEVSQGRLFCRKFLLGLSGVLTNFLNPRFYNGTYK